jgi:O-6-methylguanine DNA methyltransferase
VIARRTRPAAAEPTIRVREIDSPDGVFFLAMAGEGDSACLIETGWTRMRPIPEDWRSAPRLAPDITDRIRRALDGQAINFSDLPLPATGTFFMECRRQAQRIPCGSTISYAELARRSGSPSASRAAGQAMRRNPTPIVVPCHRVVSASGRLGGFAGDWSGAVRGSDKSFPVGSERLACDGFAAVKARLLACEARHALASAR